MLRLDPEKLYRATFICQDGLCCCNVALISFRLFRKHLGNLRDVFEQMVYRPPLAKNFPYAYDTALFMFQFHHNLLPKAFDNFLSLIYRLSMGIVKLLGLYSPDDQTQPSYGYSARLSSKSTYYIDQVSTNYSKFNIHSMHIATWRLGWLAPLVTFHKSLALKWLSWYFIHFVIMPDHR